VISLLLFGSESPIPLIPFPTGEGENKKRGADILLPIKKGGSFFPVRMGRHRRRV
jgi:hypothetical protein